MRETPRISVCIPAYDMGGQGAGFLARSFDHLVEQNFDSFDVVVADQSDSGDVARICDQYSDRLSLTRIDNRDAPRRASTNCNCALRNASGSILKVLFQDDFLADESALEKISHGFDTQSADWLLTGSCTTRDGQGFENPMVPHLNPNLHLGKNTVSSPSVLAIKARTRLMFDEDLIWLMDVEFYKRCHDQLGPPIILPEPLVANYLHADQVSAKVTPELRQRELRYVRQKHRDTESVGNRLHFFKQILKAR